MAIEVKHSFVSQKSDGSDPTQVQPSHWNSTHSIQMSSGFIIGRMSAYNGPAEQLAATTFGLSLINAGNAAAARGTLGAVNKAGDTMTGTLNLPEAGLNVGTGQLVVTGAGSSTSVTTTGSISATGNVTAYSDERLKENITTLTDALKLTRQLRGVRYIRKATGQVNIGVIAQEVGNVVPEVVMSDSQGMYSVAYGNLTALLIEAVKELSERLEALERKEAI